MKNLLSILILAMAVQVASAIEYLTPVTYPDGTLYRLTNFFSANSNLLNAAVSHPEASGGAPGADGTNGVDGVAATISIGSVTTGAAGSSASVVNSGTSSAAVFDITIPRGDKGEKGDSGANGTNALSDAWKKGVVVNPASSGTNYWVDFALTNSANVRAIYRTILATNDVYFLGLTNALLDDVASFSILASGADRLITFPPLPHLDTNSLTLSGGRYSLTLTNEHLLVFTVQTNALTLTTLWNTPEQ